MKYFEPKFAVCDRCEKGKCPFYVLKPFNKIAVCTNGGFSEMVIDLSKELKK